MGLLNINKNEQSPCCQICVYVSKNDDGAYVCTKKKKEVLPYKKCWKFKLDIMTMGAKRKRTVDEVNPDDFSIY